MRLFVLTEITQYTDFFMTNNAVVYQNKIIKPQQLLRRYWTAIRLLHLTAKVGMI